MDWEREFGEDCQSTARDNWFRFPNVKGASINDRVLHVPFEMDVFHLYQCFNMYFGFSIWFSDVSIVHSMGIFSLKDHICWYTVKSVRVFTSFLLWKMHHFPGNTELRLWEDYASHCFYHYLTSLTYALSNEKLKCSIEDKTLVPGTNRNGIGKKNLQNVRFCIACYEKTFANAHTHIMYIMCVLSEAYHIERHASANRPQDSDIISLQGFV